MPMSEDEWDFEDAVEQEDSFMQMEGCLLPELEELLLAEDTDIPASPIPPATVHPAETEAEASTVSSSPCAHVLPEQEADIVSSSPSVRRARLRSKTTAPPYSPLNVTPTPVGVAKRATGDPSVKGDLGWWLDLDEEARTKWVDSQLKESGHQEYCDYLRANHKRMPPRYYSK